MINQTGIKNYFIRGNKDRKLLVNNLKYLCQRIYLTYCPDQKHDNANDIIKNFLETINSDFRENQLSFLPGIYGMLPAYNKLQDINYWQSEDINEYMALSKIKDIAKYFNIQIKPWSEYELKNKDYSIFSKAILQFLNDEGFNNGRIKIIIKLNKLNPITGTIYQRNIRVKFFPDERIIEYTIPIRYHSQWIKKLGLSPVTVNKSLLENFILEDELMKSNNILDSQPSVYDIDFKEYKEKAEYEGFSYQHAAYKKLAETIFVGTIKHSIYLNHNISLVYIFSNNAVFKNKNEQKDTRRDVGLGGLFLVLDKELVEKKDNIAIKYFSRISDTLANRIVNFYHFQQIQTQALRAAISQVMARNTSHNIGAHVMNKLIGDLSQLNFVSFKNYESEIKLYIDQCDNNKKLLDQISIFNNYVKCRMDYLADVSFGTPLMQTNKYAYGELFTELDKVRLLLEHISGLDNWKFEIKFTRNGEPLKSENDLLVAIPNDILGTQAFYNILENIIRNTAKHAQKQTMKDKAGNDITPITIFTVNFIDSVEVDDKKVVDYCKCKKADCGKVHKKEIENALNEFIAVEVYDDIPVEGNPKQLSEKELNEYKRMMGDKKPDFDGYIDYLVFSQNSKLNEDILSENSKLRSYSLGLVEMDASAAYLRKRPVEYINHRSYDIQYDESWSRNTEKNEKDKNGLRGTNCRHFLKAFKKTVTKENDREEHYLGYRFFLHRPAVVLVVTDMLNDDKDTKDKLKKEGIWIVTKEEFEKDLTADKVFPHEFVVFATEEKGSFEHLIKEHKTSLPIRILELSNEELYELLQKKITDDKNPLAIWEEFCWSKWYKGDSDNPKLEVDILKPKCDKKNGDTEKSIEAVYLDHLYSVTNETPQIMWKNETYATHLEALSSLAQSKLPDFAKLTENIKESKDKLKSYLEVLDYNNVVTCNSNVITHHKIAESVLTKVIVIDERIQNTTKEPSVGGREFMTIPFRELYNKMGVIVPDKALNLSENSFDTIKIEIEKFIESEIKHVKQLDFILIHYSILERMYEKDKIKDKLEDWSKSINVVVTSGRGIPNNLSEKVRFVNLSSVITSFVDLRSKFAINYLLNSSRKSNKI